MYYELSLLTPVLDSNKREGLLKEIEEKIVKLNGKVEDRFIEKKFFAYPVKKNEEGFLWQINFSLEKNKLREFQEYLKTKKEIIRSLLESKKKTEEAPEARRERRKPTFKRPPKKEKVKIEDLDKKLEEILK